ncbi:hypothetical protein ACFWA4_38905 [Streptomyces sp. NPDC060011]|uniref:hypothetical protein n=1 Tax=Streptomyces sp. NPDC060011 TaxID=3347037 RepID=UPI00369818B7
MSRKPTPGRSARSVAAGINDIEGFLLVQAERETACREADEFVGRLSWMTTAQREDVTRHYVEERLRLTRLTLTAVSRRAHLLRGEYEARYALLRRRLLKAVAVIVCAALVWTASVTTWMWWALSG